MKKPIVGYTSPDEVEAAFYSAFSRCDLEAMQTLWASGDALCVHPGADSIRGYESIIRSWESIFTGAEHPTINFNVIRHFGGDDVAVHMVEEHIRSPGVLGQEAVVFATNVYRREAQGWIMVAHHASVVPVRQARGRTLQ